MTTTDLSWDQWRQDYPTLTYAQQQAFHSELWDRYPTQRHFDTTLVARAIEDTAPTTVVELGGWDGELAYAMLDRYPSIKTWTNVELCDEARQAGLERYHQWIQGRQDAQRRYSAPHLYDWYWHHTWDCDLFVGSHVIEHLTIGDLHNTVKATNAGAFFFDAPLANHPIDWRGSTTTHILNAGWDRIDRIMDMHGYQPAWRVDHETDPSSGEQATAILYTQTPA